MKVKILNITADAGKCHFAVEVQRLPAGRTWTLQFHRSDILVRDEEQEVSREKKVRDRIVSAVRESGSSGAAAIRTFLLNKEFDI